jgi:hypothetical protein
LREIVSGGAALAFGAMVGSASRDPPPALRDRTRRVLRASAAGNTPSGVDFDAHATGPFPM